MSMTPEQMAFMQAIHERYAVKSFDPTQKIDDDTLSKILEAGQYSPTSFGLEFTRFIVVRDQALKEALKPACGDQAQIDSCSDLVIFISRNDMLPDSEYVLNQFKRWGLPDENFAGLMQFYSYYLERLNEQTMPFWAGKQAYIALGNMMTAAQMFGIGSCPIEGFDIGSVMNILGLDAEKETLHVIMALGAPNDVKRPKYRLPLSELVTYR
ncbi:NAD(P)H-dependent oxidoreductase [Hydrogenovibrio sp. JE_KL2]|uniref:NAD(P)H-dependent oxidoreductase n=1 Tax=Hydrogenovibrio sp. JE_KL2 TaxID=2651188 RepID=UPI00128C235C|nr:NAD(P)H-dependent oxidoreductase [Hydrogenovibrio sp. JE_KL2]MPQ76506.1 NAD(P)H-dependent oxidoreductase [Hydrogenovibrio sp. JE_KL2]